MTKITEKELNKTEIKVQSHGHKDDTHQTREEWMNSELQ